MRRKRTFALIIFVVLAAIGVTLGYLGLSPISLFTKSAVPATEGTNEVNMTNRVSVLLVGADQRPGEEKFNTDSLILASIDPMSQRISLLSIPRDTRVSIPGYPNIKINAIASLKDMKTLERVVSDLTGISLAGHIQTNFSGFKQIIDTLGGITVDVEKNMYYETGDETDGYINLKKGVQRLDGSQALQYARFRHDALADISRTARQQVVLKAVAHEMLQISTLPKLPWLIPQLNKAVQTNLSLNDMLKLSKAAVGFENADIVSQTLPGKFMDLEGVSYWGVDPQDAKKVMHDLLQGITTIKVIEDQDVDLLKPIVTTPSKSLPQVPGNIQDPNGQESAGHQKDEGNWPLGPDGGA